MTTSSSPASPPAVRIALPRREPPRGAIWPASVLQRSGLEMLRALLDGGLPSPPVAMLTGLRLSEVGLGMATASMPASPWWQSGAGVFLAGTVAFVADLPLSAAVLTSAPSGTVLTTSQISVSLLRTPTIGSQTFIGRGRLIHGTRTQGLSEAIIEDGRGRLLGHATSRCVLMPAEPSAFPASPIVHATPLNLPDPYQRPVEGDVMGQEYWDSTPGLEIVQQIAAGALYPPVMMLMDMRGVEAREGEFTMAMPASAWLCNALGTVFGGALALLADVAMTLAVGSTVPAATAYSVLDLSVHFLRPVFPDNGDLVARGRVTHRGRTIAVTTCEITDAKGRLAARASGSTLILPGRPWARPVNVGEEMTTDEMPVYSGDAR